MFRHPRHLQYLVLQIVVGLSALESGNGESQKGFKVEVMHDDRQRMRPSPGNYRTLPNCDAVQLNWTEPGSHEITESKNRFIFDSNDNR
jgi:hypothetical protein